MELSNNEILSALQKEIIQEFFRITDKFYLTGGTPLSAFYLKHRYSIDFDFFTSDEIAFQNINTIIHKICKNLAKKYSIITDTFYFKHINVIDNSSRELLILHFSYDITEQFNKIKNRFDNIIVDTLEDILINKICAILGRSEIKDLIDLYFIAQEGYDILKYIPYAQKKNGGLEKEVLAYCLNNIKIDFDDKMMIKKVTIEQLNTFKEDLLKKLLT